MGGREGGSSAALYVLDGSTLRAAGGANGLATLDGSGTLTPSQVPASIANGLTFQATWNASTNTPTLPPVSTPNPGDYWIVTTAGATALPGAAGPWTVGQCAVFNGTDWDVLQMYPLAIGLPVAGASPTWVLYVDGSGNLATAATGATSGVQAYSAALAAIAGNGTPTAWGLARMLDANQAANQSALGLAALAYLATVGTAQIDDAAVTLGKMANLDTDRLIGRDSSGTGVPESLTVGGGLEFTGAGGIQRSALSGDVDASAGSGTTTIGANKVTDAMLRQSAGLSVIGRSGNSTGNVADITAASDGQVLRRSGTSIGFGTADIAGGGTGGGTVAAANYNLANGVGVIDPSSPYTQTTGVRRIVFTAGTAKTVNLIALSDLQDGEVVTVYNASTSSVAFTLDPNGSETLDGGAGGASVAYTVPARGAVGVQRLSATAWGSVQSGGMTGVRVRIYGSGGVIYSVLEANISGSWATIKGPVTLSKTAGTASLGVTASGTGLSYPAGYATLADQPSEGDQWIEALNGAGGLGVTWTPGTASSATWTVYASGDPGANYIRAAAYLGRSDLTSGFRIAYGRHTATLVVSGQGNDIAEGTGQACTWDAPGVAWMAWRGATNIAEVGVGYGRRNGTMVATTGTAPSSALGSSLVFALVATRPALGGGTGALSGLEAIFYPAAGELSW